MAEEFLVLAEHGERAISDTEIMDAYSLLAKGKRNLVCGEIPKAVNQLQDACRTLAEKFGETADECGEVYYYYGKALLDLSRMESGVLGNALDGIDEKSEESDDKTSSDDVIEQDETTEGETSQEEGEVESEDIADEEEGEEGDQEGEEQEGEEVEGAEGESGKEETAEESEKKEDDVSNLQLAWEMLELSKIIHTRHADKKENRLKLADTFLQLGEVGLETEQYETAIADFKECLKVQKETLDAEDRALAETYYQLGLACCFNAQYDDSVSYYRCASNSIETKIASLQKVIEEGEKEGKGKEQANPDDPLIKAQKELKDLQDILPDIMAKIEDVLDEKRSADKVKAMVKENVAADLGQTSTGFGQTSKTESGDSAPTDITHLVRKKRKPDEEAASPTKKAKTENGSGDSEAKAMNGTSHDSTSKVNGEAKKVEAAS